MPLVFQRVLPIRLPSGHPEGNAPKDQHPRIKRSPTLTALASALCLLENAMIRMVESSFALFRGAVVVMAFDLVRRPTRA